MSLKETYMEFASNKEINNDKVINRLKDQFDLQEFVDHFIKKNESEAEKDTLKLLRHSTYVVEIAEQIILESEISKDDIKLVLSAALLHDICKFDEKRNCGEINHNILGKEYVLENKVYEDEDTNKLLGKVIEFHKDADLVLDEREFLLCNIVFDADKISKVLKKKSWLNENKEFDMVAIKKTLSKIEKKLKLKQSQDVLKQYLNEMSL